MSVHATAGAKRPSGAAGDAAIAGRCWSIAIFAARESAASLIATIEAVSVAAAGTATVVDVLVNGNPALAAQVARHSINSPRTGHTPPLVRVWRLALGDKAHAWNEYLHRIRPGCDVSFFIDGYVRLRPDTLRRLATALQMAPTALAATAVPTVGRSAAAMREQMLAEGGIHGNCFCVPENVLERLAQMRFHLPLGLYRVDAMIGAVLAFRLDPAQHAWDLKHTIVVDPAATWETDQKSPWRLADLRATLKRRDRQAQGELENLAMRDHLSVRHARPQDMPATAAEFVLDWANRRPDELALAIRRNRRVARALAALRSPRDWSAAERVPEMLTDATTSEPAWLREAETTHQAEATGR